MEAPKPRSKDKAWFPSFGTWTSIKMKEQKHNAPAPLRTSGWSIHSGTSKNVQADWTIPPPKTNANKIKYETMYGYEFVAMIRRTLEFSPAFASCYYALDHGPEVSRDIYFQTQRIIQNEYLSISRFSFARVGKGKASYRKEFLAAFSRECGHSL